VNLYIRLEARGFEGVLRNLVKPCDLRQRLPHGNAREIKPSCALTTHAVQDARSKCFRRGEHESSEEFDLYFVCV